MSAGIMTQQWTVWCCDCTKFDQVSGTKREAAKRFASSGWVLLRYRSGAGVWVCAECAANRKRTKL